MKREYLNDGNKNGRCKLTSMFAEIVDSYQVRCLMALVQWCCGYLFFIKLYVKHTPSVLGTNPARIQRFAV